MSSNDIFWGIADFFQPILSVYDSIGNKFNYAVIVLGFIGLFYWLNLQRGYIKEERNKKK